MKEKKTESIYDLVKRIVAEAKKLNFPDSIRMVAALEERDSSNTMILLNQEMKNRVSYEVLSTKNIVRNGSLTTIFLTKT